MTFRRAEGRGASGAGTASGPGAASGSGTTSGAAYPSGGAAPALQLGGPLREAVAVGGPLAAGQVRQDPAPALPLQVNALQALCRQVFGFRLAMIALGTPFALGRAAPGAATWLVAGSVLVTFMGSYVLFRDWERFGPYLLRHRWVLAVDMLLGSLLLISATPESPLGFVTVCTPLLAGLVYGWRGSALYAAAQAVIVAAVFKAEPAVRGSVTGMVTLACLCLVAGAVGVALRNLLFRFGAASQALTETRARLAVTEAIGAERARLAREMHDSVAKTLHGLALAADGLAASASASAAPLDPQVLQQQAELVARSARRAAAESRELLADLRREDPSTAGVDLAAELDARVRDFAARTGIPTDFRPTGAGALPPIPRPVAREILTVTAEALENAHRHAEPRQVVVEAGVVEGLLRVGVLDDGRGLPPGTTLEALRTAGHFGLVGMVERAAAIGARIRIGRGRTASGTEVRLDLPVAAFTRADP
ncbi:sensor histidine kinase [Streptomyces sp. NRRL S-87]|uniref:sensor histidine kinase n=1 Tax=Streptomyces sp. NRRL S-87 TaxID=1463920 RepID=UPI0004BF9B06|nr:histidine kinase [Streptomyces sp. NRRL S-87]